MKGNESKLNKPWYKKWWIWLIIVIVVGGIGNAIDGEEKTAAPATAVEQAAVPAEAADATPEPATPVEEPAAETPVAEEPAAKEPVAEAPAEEPVAEPAVADETLNKQDVLDYTANIRGRAFLKEVQVGERDISVSYHTDFKEYKAANPESAFNEEDYLNYFSSGDEINKIMMEESARLLKEFPSANEIKISLPFEGKTYSVDLQEDAAEKFFDVDFDTLKASDPTGGNAEWRTQVSDKYFNDADRQRFVSKFVTVQ